MVIPIPGIQYYDSLLKKCFQMQLSHVCYSNPLCLCSLATPLSLKQLCAGFYNFRVCCHIITPPPPPRACAARGYVISRGVYAYDIAANKLELFSIFQNISDTHFNTGRLLFEFNRLLYTLAAPEVFMASANPVSLLSGYRVSIGRNTNIDRSIPHPYGYARYG